MNFIQDIFATRAELIGFLKDLFLYREGAPVPIFTQLYFWGFLAIIILLYSIVYKKKWSRNTYLFAISLFFYYKTCGLFFFLLIFSTIADYLIGMSIHRSRKKSTRVFFLTLSIIINLTVLSYFKYGYFFTESANHLFETNFEVFNYLSHWFNNLSGTNYFDVDVILLPVGISFFTFQTISYSVDVFRGKCQPVKNIIDFGFYVSFFPQLVSGPIVRAAEFVPQLYQKYSLTRQEFGYALFLILKGLIKKMVIGDYIAVNFVDRVFENPVMYTGFENLSALYGYSLQVYCDFAGYTDIAIGVALLMGFRLPNNFNSPYKALHVGEFWRRWHMSLSSWLKDYLYIPLGGNKKASLFTMISVPAVISFLILYKEWDWFYAGLLFFAICYWVLSLNYPRIWIFPILSMLAMGVLALFLGSNGIWVPTVLLWIIILLWIFYLIFPSIKVPMATDLNLMITMLLGGLWHGAHVKFIIWGGLNGLGLVIYKFWRHINPYEHSNLLVVRFWRILLTFSFITFTRIFFRAYDMDKANALMKQIGTNFSLEVIPSIVVTYWKVFLVMFIGFFLHWAPSSWKEESRGWFIRMPMVVKAVITLVIVFLIIQMSAADIQPFIYFQF